jgi:hypothetical protein
MARDAPCCRGRFHQHLKTNCNHRPQDEVRCVVQRHRVLKDGILFSQIHKKSGANLYGGRLQPQGKVTS